MSDENLPAAPPQDFWDRSDDRSLMNVVPQTLQQALIEHSQKRPELFGHDERTLWKALRVNQNEPNQTDNQLRMKFWFEYETANSERRNVELVRIYSGVCSRQYFYSRYLTCPEKLAWMVTPPLDYQLKLDEVVAYGAERMRDILEIDPAAWSPKKTEQMKLMEMQAKIYAMMDARKHGAYTQKIDQRNMNLTVSTSDKSVAAQVAGSTMEQLERRLKDLKTRERRALNLPVKNDDTQKPETAVEAEVTDPS